MVINSKENSGDNLKNKAMAAVMMLIKESDPKHEGVSEAILMDVLNSITDTIGVMYTGNLVTMCMALGMSRNETLQIVMGHNDEMKNTVKCSLDKKGNLREYMDMFGGINFKKNAPLAKEISMDRIWQFKDALKDIIYSDTKTSGDKQLSKNDAEKRVKYIRGAIYYPVIFILKALKDCFNVSTDNVMSICNNITDKTEEMVRKGYDHLLVKELSKTGVFK